MENDVVEKKRKDDSDFENVVTTHKNGEGTFLFLKMPSIV